MSHLAPQGSESRDLLAPKSQANVSELRQGLVHWLRDKLTSTGARGFVFGMSGGVDSNVTALLAAESVGTNHLGLILPIHNDPRERAAAERLVEEFKLHYQTIDLSATYDEMLSVLPPSDEITKTNFKARLRMSVLYYYANLLQYLVIGTINKAEFTIGYFAKYGSYGDILPLTDLLKRDIRDLALELGMPEDLAIKPASGCASGSGTAADEWGIPEDDLDELVRQLHSPIADSPQLRHVRELSASAEHKRAFPPIFRVGQPRSGSNGDGK